ncbi:MAG: tetratricopeptide repeat protein [Candidatus Methylumidiphilus sp.]
MDTQKLFISHSSEDDHIVRRLQQALGNFQIDVWIDSRELRGGDLFWLDIQHAINESAAFAVVVSPQALQSRWVGKELRHALLEQERRGKEAFPVIALSLDGTKLGVLEGYFKDEPLYLPLSSAAGGIDAALDAILVALGKRQPADAHPEPQPQAEPLEELVLELTDLKLYTQDGKRRAQARARLIYEPANAHQPKVQSKQRWPFIAPLGPIEAEELRWYLEKYAIWPSRYFGDRAAKVEANLKAWGGLLHDAALPNAHTANVLQAWAKIDSHAGRRFSVYVDKTLEADATPEQETQAQESATLLLGLPWELLHDGKAFLFQGAQPSRVRRRLPNTEALDVAVVDLPIRILLVTARPEDDACGYIDHRASALPLVEAMEALGGLVQIHLLNPPTLPALSVELDRARNIRQPYHVVHFDGHGVYNRHVGLGGLCFEDPQDEDELERRRHQTIYTDQLGPLLRAHRIPLVFLEACQTAQAEKASESVASELLHVGVASVVAMSHSVLVETASRFVKAFYLALAQGKRVGAAMLAGQRGLHEDSFRGRVFGAGELRLHDWFVPVLFQEKDDPQLFRATPARQTQADTLAALHNRLGHTPPPPDTGFIGRSRDLLALQRLLRRARYAVVVGQGGEGKTTLAAEFARWQLRSQQCQRVAFVSVEMHSTAHAVLDALGQQLLPNYSVATYADWDKAIQPVERALREQSTLLVLDNMESLLPPPYLLTSDLLRADLLGELEGILGLCARLLGMGNPLPQPLSHGERGVNATRIIFTSREHLPAPFDGARHHRELHQLHTDDAVKLVERVLNADQNPPAPDDHALALSPSPGGRGVGERENKADALTESIEQLVAAVHGHARTLALLAPALREYGVEQTRIDLVKLMAAMKPRDPDESEREYSLYASVALSLNRLSPANQDRVRVLGLFQGGAQLDVLRYMTGWEDAEVVALAEDLLATGLATRNPYNHLSLNPALCPYLLERLDKAEQAAWTPRWQAAMDAYAEYLGQQRDQNPAMAAALTGRELPNLFALLHQRHQAGEAEATIALLTTLHRLLLNLGKPRVLQQLGQWRDAAAAKLGASASHAGFEAQRTRIEQQLASGQWRAAHAAAQALLQQAQAAGGQSYAGADYDLAGAYWLLARVLRTGGAAAVALPLLDEAQQGFEARADTAAAGMASACIGERADCLRDLGRLDEAAAAYQEAIRRAEQRGDVRDVAVCQGQLGTVYLLQRRYPEALAAYQLARERFSQLDEPGSVAVYWHQTGMAYQDAGQPEAAEDAYRQALAISVRLGDVAGQADTLAQLGGLYDHALGRTEEAVGFTQKALDHYIVLDNQADAGRQRSNLAIRLYKLQRLDEARQHIQQAIDSDASFGHAAEPWKSWGILSDIETDAQQPAAAATAKAHAIDAYLAYRRDGGENHNGSGRLAFDVTQALLANDPASAAGLLQTLIADPDYAEWLPYLQALQAIVHGNRDPSLADAPELDYSEVAELRLLLETLAAAQP